MLPFVRSSRQPKGAGFSRPYGGPYNRKRKRRRSDGLGVSYGMLTTWRSPLLPSPVEGGSSPSSLAVIRSASISCLTLKISCSFIRSTSSGFFMGEGSFDKYQHQLSIRHRLYTAVRT